VGYSAGINWYVYCRNNPGVLVDPMGLCGSNMIYSNSQQLNGQRYQSIQRIENERANLILESKFWNAEHNYGYIPIYHDCAKQAEGLGEHLVYEEKFTFEHWRLDVQGRSKVDSPSRQTHLGGFAGNHTVLVAIPNNKASELGYKPFTIDPYRSLRETIPGFRNWDVDVGTYEDFVREYPYVQH
jgi:hypothetical protein